MIISRKVYSEIYAVLLALGDEYIEPIPDGFFSFIATERDMDYVPHIDENKVLHEQGLTDETVAMIAMLKLDYWCKTDGEKAELLRVLKTNEEEISMLLENAASTRELMKLLKKGAIMKNDE